MCVNSAALRATYIIIGILVIDIRGELLAQDSQLPLNVARLGEDLVHVIVLLRQPLGNVHRDTLPPARSH